MADIERTVITSAQAPQPLGAHSLGTSARPRKLVYLAGQVSVDADGTLMGKGDAAAQTRQALQNLGHVLSGAGADSSNVVEFTTYVVGRSSIQEYIKGRSEVYPEILSGWRFPSQYPLNSRRISQRGNPR